MAEHHYTIHTDDNKTHSVKSDLHHTHPDFMDNIKTFIKNHYKGIGLTAASIALLTHGNVVIWKK